MEPVRRQRINLHQIDDRSVSELMEAFDCGREQSVDRCGCIGVENDEVVRTHHRSERRCVGRAQTYEKPVPWAGKGTEVTGSAQSEEAKFDGVDSGRCQTADVSTNECLQEISPAVVGPTLKCAIK